MTTNYASLTLLTSDFVTTTFDCGKPALNYWLSQKALANQSGGGSRTWVVVNDGHVVAFYASATAAILHTEDSGRGKRNQPDPIPAILLGRLAVDQKHHGNGVASGLVKHCILKALEVSELVGVRLLLVHAMDDEARDFYLGMDFEPSPMDDHTLMLLLKDARASLDLIAT